MHRFPVVVVSEPVAAQELGPAGIVYRAFEVPIARNLRVNRLTLASGLDNWNETFIFIRCKCPRLNAVCTKLRFAVILFPVRFFSSIIFQSVQHVRPK